MPSLPKLRFRKRQPMNRFQYPLSMILGVRNAPYSQSDYDARAGGRLIPTARMVTSPMRQCIVTRQLLPSGECSFLMLISLPSRDSRLTLDISFCLYTADRLDFLIRLRPTYFPPDPQPQPRNSSPADLANASLKDDNQAIHPKPKPQSKPKSKSKSTNDPSMGGFYLTPCLSHSADTQTQTQSQSQTQPHTTPSRSYYITAHPSILARIHSAGPHLSLLKRFPDGALRIPADLDGWVRAELFERVLEELRLRRARAGSERGSRSGSGELMTVTVTVTMLEPAGPSSPDVTTWSQSLPPESQSIIVQVPPPTPPESDVVADPTSPLSNPPSSTSAAPIPRVILNPPPDLRNQLLAEIAGILAQEQPDQSSAVSPSLSSLSVDSAAGVTLAMTSRPGTKSMVPLMVALLRVRLMSGEGWEQIAR